MLSLGYTLLHAEAVLAAHAVGLDPLIGFYHFPAFGRESLASDLVEGLRAEVDAWALTLFNSQTLRATDFSITQEGCFLGKAGRERFYRAWEPLAENLRKQMDAQARTMIAMMGRRMMPLRTPSYARNGQRGPTRTLGRRPTSSR